MGKSKPKVVLEAKKVPYFVCPTCGLEDYMGNTQFCPVCDPEKDAEQDMCYFVDYERTLCRQDGKTCSFAEEKNWGDCPKLEGLGKSK